MKRSPLSLSSLSLAALLAACNAPSPTGQAAAPAPATSATAAAAAPATATPAQPEASPATHFTLTMGKVDAYVAAIRNLGVLVEKDPALEDTTSMDASETSEQYAARLRANPQVAAAIAKAGITPEEFARTGDALTGGMMTAGALESGALKKIPDGIDPQNVAFAQQNKVALAERMKALQQPPAR